MHKNRSRTEDTQNLWNRRNRSKQYRFIIKKKNANQLVSSKSPHIASWKRYQRRGRFFLTLKQPQRRRITIFLSYFAFRPSYYEIIIYIHPYIIFLSERFPRSSEASINTRSDVQKKKKRRGDFRAYRKRIGQVMKVRRCNSPSLSRNKRDEEEVISESIPFDIVIEIFMRLPAKSVARFRCVSKLCGSTLSSPDFTESFYTISSSLARSYCLPS